ncbi:D-glycerate dehydrogenase [Veillonella caviae]|uniref:2-hydroxyacid dehydrogenase n=1 Tax=Veillonella caviae TaxID=248316 RepID=UPI002A918EFF|nr:D-glycerate dehydrogenase [Veillonella caviae]MDY5786677.1 D-glycerate dehydrogenase [Veillonella caviae]
MKKKPVVVVNGLVRKDAMAYLAEHVEIRQWTEKTVMPREILKEWLKEADGLWSVRPLTVDGDLIKDAPNLKVIAQAAVGYDNVKIDELTAAGIPYGNTPGVLNETVAELAFTIIATASRRILENVTFVKSGRWAERPSNIKGFDLSRRTLGIIGMGAIGLAISRRARAFGMTVVYHNRHPRQDDAIYRTTYMELDELLATSDVVCIMAPLTDETYHMCDAEFFKKMKSTALFVNVGRGPIVDTEALIEALKTGVIDYAALDVTDPEPLPADHPLLSLDNCLIVPHIGSYTDRTRYDMSILTADNIIAGVHKQRLKCCVNEEVNYEKTKMDMETALAELKAAGVSLSDFED